MISLLQEARHTLREMPWTVALLALTIMFASGAHGDLYYEADAPQVRLIANHEAHVVSLLRASDRDPCEEMIPGVTVVVGLKEYSVELTVPVAGMLGDAPTKFASGQNKCNSSAA